MKRILLTTVSLGVLGLVSPVLGADLPSYSKAPVLASPVYDWSGFYVGVFGGYGFGNHNISDGLGNSSNFSNFTANYGSQGGFGGGVILEPEQPVGGGQRADHRPRTGRGRGQLGARAPDQRDRHEHGAE